MKASFSLLDQFQGPVPHCVSCFRCYFFRVLCFVWAWSIRVFNQFRPDLIKPKQMEWKWIIDFLEGLLMNYISGSNLWRPLQLNKTEKGRWLFFDSVHCHWSGSLLLNGICVCIYRFTPVRSKFHTIFIRTSGTTELTQKSSSIASQHNKICRKNHVILSQKSTHKNTHERFRGLFHPIWWLKTEQNFISKY